METLLQGYHGQQLGPVQPRAGFMCHVWLQDATLLGWWVEFGAWGIESARPGDPTEWSPAKSQGDLHFHPPDDARL